MEYPFRNLVFEGGGVKGIAYLGALEILSGQGILQQITRIGGTSAGAINAVLLGLGYTPREITDILWSMDFKTFMDDSWGVIRDIRRLARDYGWHKGDVFRDWIAELIHQKTGNGNATFADIEAMKQTHNFKSLYFIGTNLSTSFSEVFSAEHTPRTSVADAVRISMSIPLFFAAQRNLRGDVYVDGGLLRNYPVKLFDRRKYLSTDNYSQPEYYQSLSRQLPETERPISAYVYNKETLGFRLDTRQEIARFRDQAEPPRRRIDSFKDYTCALLHCLIESQQSTHLHSDDWARTVYIDTLGIGTTDFEISDAQKEALVTSGRDNTQAYLDWYGNPEPKPNR